MHIYNDMYIYINLSKNKHIHVYINIYIITESRQGDVFWINFYFVKMLTKKTSPCLDSVSIYQNQHVELTLKLCLLHHIYIYKRHS